MKGNYYKGKSIPELHLFHCIVTIMELYLKYPNEYILKARWI